MLNNRQIRITLQQRFIWCRPTSNLQKTALFDLVFFKYIVYDIFFSPTPSHLLLLSVGKLFFCRFGKSVYLCTVKFKQQIMV